MATSVLITTSDVLANKVREKIEEQLKKLTREEIARTSIDNNGKIILVDSIEEAIELSNELAPEHLEICVDNPFDYLNKVDATKSNFVYFQAKFILKFYLKALLYEFSISSEHPSSLIAACAKFGFRSSSLP